MHVIIHTLHITIVTPIFWEADNTFIQESISFQGTKKYILCKLVPVWQMWFTCVHMVSNSK